MKLSYDDHNTISVLTVSGELTDDQADTFRRVCLERFEAGARDVVVQMEHMSLVDSAGLELLLWLLEEVAERSGQLRLVSPDETVSRILEVTRLDRRLNIHDSVESAAKSLR